MKIPKRPSKNQQAGFTIIEIMIATLIFSVVLLICTFALLQIGKVYYKGINASKTQETARSISDAIGRGIQFSGASVAATPQPATATFVFCVGDRRYSTITHQQVEDSVNDSTHQGYHALVVDDYPGCNSGSPSLDLSTAKVNGQELLGLHMRLAKLEVKDLGDNLFEINVRVVYGNDDLLCSPSASAGDCSASGTSANLNKSDLSCKTATGSQFCAASELNTVVQKRI